MEDEKMGLYLDRSTGRVFRMSKSKIDEMIKERDKLLKNDLIKEAKIVSLQGFLDEIINQYLPDDQKIIVNQGTGWSTAVTDDNPFLMVKF